MEMCKVFKKQTRVNFREDIWEKKDSSVINYVFDNLTVQEAINRIIEYEEENRLKNSLWPKWIETGDMGYIEDTAIYEFQCSKCKSLAYFKKSFNSNGSFTNKSLNLNVTNLLIFLA